MVLVLDGGPHGSCHFKWEEFVPPARIRLPAQRRSVAVYELTGRRPGHWVYARSWIERGEPPPIVEFITSQAN